jgi:N-acetyl-gamma-glutamyl-phosphate reductase
MPKIKVGIAGATGYTGSELMRLLTFHPEVEVVLITSESKAGMPLSSLYPQFRGISDLHFQSAKVLDEADLDLLFLALPHGAAMDYVARLSKRDLPIVDLSGDFRLSSPEVYEQWYGMDHRYQQGFQEAVYGLPELFRDDIAKAKLVANPGCYPTAAILSLLPLLSAGLADPKSLVVDSKSGVTGAGAKPKASTHFPGVNDNFQAYGLKSHRHTPEMQETLSKGSGEEVSLLFTPHLLPLSRGILSTSYAQAKGAVSKEALQAAYQDFYADEPFVRVCDRPVSLQQVRGSNYCDLYVDYDERTEKVIVLGAIDNLVKGAAGQAVQNMNLMLGLEEGLGLREIIPLSP